MFKKNFIFFLDNITILPWWHVQVAYITEDDIKNAIDKAEHCLIDQIIDNGACPTGYLNYQTIKQLFNKGFIYFDVPIEDEDYVVVPPLEGFVSDFCILHHIHTFRTLFKFLWHLSGHEQSPRRFFRNTLIQDICVNRRKYDRCRVG